MSLIEARGAIAQIRVLRHGQVVLDRAFGCRPDSLFLSFSAGKPFVATLVHQLAERGHGPVTLVRQVVFNRRGVRAAVVPAATVSTTAQDLTRFYQMLLRGGEVDGVRVLRPETVAQAMAPSANGETDRLLRLPVRWSQGFQLGGPAPDPSRPRPMGAASSPDAFGHNGSNCCLAWADPSRGLVFAYLTNRLSTSFDGSPHQSEVSDAILTACL